MGLQREVTPQPDPKAFHVGEDAEGEEEQAGAQKSSTNDHEGISSENLFY